MKFFVILRPAKWKVGNASHFINVERRLKRQVDYIRGVREKGKIEGQPFAILNAEAAMTSFMANVDSWEELSHILHEDPMAVYQTPEIHYLADWEQAMNKHAQTIGSDDTMKDLMEDVRIDMGEQPREAGRSTSQR